MRRVESIPAKGKGDCSVTINYNKLWKLLIDKKMTKGDLRELSGVSTASMAKLSKGANITTDVLIKICTALDCDICDIMELDRDEVK